MATGDRVKIITSAQFDPINEQINDATDGLATKVNQLESNPVYTLVEGYRTDFNYPAGYPILRDGRLEVCIGSTSGAYDPSKWEVLTRKDRDPIIVQDIESAFTISGFDSGIYTLIVSNGVESKQFKYSLQTGRVIHPTAVTLAEAGDKDSVIKEDLKAYTEKAFEEVSLPEGARVALVDELGKVDYYDNVQVEDLFKLTQTSHNNTTKRFTQTDAVTAVATDEKDVLTKKDGDALYKATSSGYLQRASDKSDTWQTLCEVDNVKIEARNPLTEGFVPVRVVNNTENTLTHVWDILEGSGQWTEGATGNSAGGSFLIAEPPAASGSRRRILVSAYKNGEGQGNGTDAWVYQITIKRISTTGYRIIATISAN